MPVDIGNGVAWLSVEVVAEVLCVININYTATLVVSIYPRRAILLLRHSGGGRIVEKVLRRGEEPMQNTNKTSQVVGRVCV